MKIGRNEPCPCGSGKKYKKCCLLKQQRERTDMPNDEDEFDEDFAMQMTQAFRNMHMYFLKRKPKPHIKEYIKIRRLHGEILSSMVSYHDSGKFEQIIDENYIPPDGKRPVREGRTLILQDAYFDLSSNIGTQAFTDMIVYKPAPNMNCITEEFISHNHYRKPEKVEFLHSMLNSELVLFELIGKDSDEGFAFVKDVFTGREYKLTDIGLSSVSNKDDVYVFTRIITYRDITFSSGLNIVFEKSDRFIKNFIKRNKEHYQPDGSFARFIELYNQYTKNPDKIFHTNNTIR